MSFLHLYYTSSKTGINGHSGFQTYSMSPGISPQEQEEIERIGVYAPPNGFPQMADEETIEHTYPKSFYFYPLNSGRYAIGMSQYVGKDYSGRFGNYFSDTVVFDKEAFKGLPIEYFQSTAFRDKLTKEEEESLNRPKPLEVSPQLLRGEALNRLSVLQFLQQGDRSEQLKKLISALMSYQQDKRRIVIIDKDENIPYWIGAVSSVFPKAFALNISFTTYTNDPIRQNALICGVHHKETPSPMWNQQFYVFDFIRGNLSPVGQNRYADTVVDLLLDDQKELGEFLSFIAMTRWNSIDIHLNELLQLYKLVVYGPQSLDFDELKEALSMVGILKDQAGIIAITDLLLKRWGKNNDEIDSFVVEMPTESMEAIAQWWFKVAGLTNDEDHLKLAVSFFYKSWTQLLIDHGEHHQGAMSYYKHIMEKNKDNHSFSFIALAPRRLEEVYGLCKTENAQLLPLFIEDFVQHAQRLNLDETGLEKEHQTYLFQMLNLAVELKIELPSICQNLSLLQQTFLQIVKTLVIHYGDNGRSSDKTYLLSSCLSSIEEGKMNGQYFMKHLLQNKYIKESIISLLQNRMNESKTNTPITSFIPLQKGLLSQADDLQEIAKELLNHCIQELQLIPSSETFLKESELLLSSENLMNLLSDDDRIRFIELLEQRLPFSDESSRYTTLLEKLEVQTSALNSRSSVNLSKLLIMLMGLEKQKELKTDFLLFIRKQVGALTKEQYHDLLIWRGPLLIQLAQKKNRLLVMLFEALNCSENDEVFFKAITQQTTRLGKSSRATVLAAFCHCLVKNKKKLSSEQISYFEQHTALFKTVKEEAAKLHNAEGTVVYLMKVSAKLPEQKEDSLFGKVKSLLKGRKNGE